MYPRNDRKEQDTLNAYVIVTARVKKLWVFENSDYKTAVLKMSTRWKGTNGKVSWTNFSVRFTGVSAENLIKMVGEGQPIQVLGKITSTQIWGNEKDQVDISVSGVSWNFLPRDQNDHNDHAETANAAYDEAELTV